MALSPGQRREWEEEGYGELADLLDRAWPAIRGEVWPGCPVARGREVGVTTAGEGGRVRPRWLSDGRCRKRARHEDPECHDNFCEGES